MQCTYYAMTVNFTLILIHIDIFKFIVNILLCQLLILYSSSLCCCQGIGVPILLAYVYGVVPISLCRSGGCGVTTTNSGGVRFEFDEENDTTNQAPYMYGGQ